MNLAARVGPSRPSVHPFQFSLRTTRSPQQVLSELEERRLPGIGVAERGAHYLVLRPQRRYRYGGDTAVGLSVAIALVVLISTAITPWLSILLPLAIAPSLPLLFDNRPDLAASAVEDDDGATRVTVHGQASPELAAALDAYLGALPKSTSPPGVTPADDSGRVPPSPKP